jgi:hypothetical protein
MALTKTGKHKADTCTILISICHLCVYISLSVFILCFVTFVSKLLELRHHTCVGWITGHTCSAHAAAHLPWMSRTTVSCILKTDSMTYIFIIYLTNVRIYCCFKFIWNVNSCDRYLTHCRCELIIILTGNVCWKRICNLWSYGTHKAQADSAY